MIIVSFIGKNEDPSILVSKGQELKTFVPLTSDMEKVLKLPVKCPVPGRPKGSRAKGKRCRQKNKDNGNNASGDEDDDVDDVIPGR